MSQSNQQTAGVEYPHSDVLPNGATLSEKELLQLQQEESELYFACMNAVQQTTRRKILTVMVDHSGIATYNLLEEFLNVGRRTLRKQAKKLEEENIIDRTNSKTVRLSFPTVAARALAAHAISCYC